jgi:predicted RNase H-like HicB family nuclease
LLSALLCLFAAEKSGLSGTDNYLFFARQIQQKTSCRDDGIMLTEYIQRALEKAHYEIIQDEEPYYAEVPGLESVWATGPSLESCRRQLAAAIEDWLLFSVAKGLPIPVLDGITIEAPELVKS